MELCDIRDAGTLRHIWMTGTFTKQIGCCLYERSDDWSTATFWYEPVPSAPLPALVPVQARIADLQELFP